MRCFLAVEPPPRLRGLLSDVRTTILDDAPAWNREKWVAPENLHATLLFFGEVPDGEAPALAETLAPVARTLAPYELDFARLEGVPSPGRCRTLWARFADPDGLFRATVHAFSLASEDLGLPAVGRRPAVPHVTLCRARRPRAIASPALTCVSTALCEANPVMSVLSATLFASRLTPSGPVYEALQSWRFGGSSTD